MKTLATAKRGLVLALCGSECLSVATGQTPDALGALQAVRALGPALVLGLAIHLSVAAAACTSGRVSCLMCPGAVLERAGPASQRQVPPAAQACTRAPQRMAGATPRWPPTRHLQSGIPFSGGPGTSAAGPAPDAVCADSGSRTAACGPWRRSSKAGLQSSGSCTSRENRVRFIPAEHCPGRSSRISPSGQWETLRRAPFFLSAPSTS